MAENQLYLIKSGQNSFVEEAEAIIGISGGKLGVGTTNPEADFHVTGDAQIDGDLTVKGDLITVNQTTVSLDDKNIELGVGSTTDAQSDGGGITLKGATDKTFNWADLTDAWTSSENLYLANGKHLSADQLRALDSGGLSLIDESSSGILVKGGKVGIHKSTPVYDLDVDGSGSFDSLYVNGSAVLTTADGDLGKWDDGTVAGDIYYNGGSVGVGTGDPASKLHVVGDARIDGDFTINGTSGNFNVDQFNVSGEYININQYNNTLNNNRGGLSVHDPRGTGEFEYLADVDYWQLNKKISVLGDVEVQDNLIVTGLISGDPLVENNLSVGNDLNVGNDLTVSGNFEVKGTTTTVNTQTVTIEDHNLVIASNTGYNQLTAEYPSEGGGYAGLFWGTGDAGAASPVNLTYQHNKGFNFKGGNVGIDVTNPDVKLEVNGGVDNSVVFRGRCDSDPSHIGAGAGNNGRFNLVAFSSDEGNDYGGGIKIQTRDGLNVFHDRMTIDSNGNVGIGTTNPSAKLEIDNGTSPVDLQLTETSSSFHKLGIRKEGSKLKLVEFTNDGATVSENLLTADASGGNVGIGIANPTAKLDVDGEILQSGNTVVDQGDIGYEPNQIPLNKDLGTLAYMNAPDIEDLNVDTLELSEIAAEMSKTAVDVFVYDTQKDSDGGAWRSRTQHTSWYNEELNTATRGGRREFPAVAVIVAEPKRITIYDGDDPDLPMWMVFKEPVYTSPQQRNIMYAPGNITSIYALNGFIITDSQGTGFWSPLISFLRDGCLGLRGGQSSHMIYEGNLAERNVEHDLYWKGSQVDEAWWLKDRTVNNYVHDVAMTVLPNAPIDAETGLPIPTIAVATNGGVSVIRDDGSVVDITCSQTSFGYSYYVVFDQLNRLFFSLDAQGNSRRIWGLNNIPATDLVITTNINEKQNGDIFIADNNGFGTATKDMFLFNQSNPQVEGFTSDNSIGTSQGLFKAFINKEDSSKSLYNYITSSYNTGWMSGDIKLATLSDTKIEKVGEGDNPELITNGQFNSDVSGWTNIDPSGSPDATITWSNGTAQVFRPTGQSGRFYQVIDTIVGAEYFITIGNYGGDNGGVYVADSPDASSWNIIANNGQIIRDNNKHYFTAITTSTYIVLNSAIENQSVTFDNISVKRSGEFITNGTFDADSDWTKGTGWTINGGVATKTGSDNTSISQDIDTIAGKNYVVSLDIVSGTGNSGAKLYVDGVLVLDNLKDAQSISANFVATDDSTTIAINGGSFDGGSIDNISVRLAEPDRSVNDNGLQIFGEIDKTPVAPSADLVAYSGFSADDYLMQPYNPDLDFGTGDFCVMGWAKNSDSSSTYKTLLYRNTANISGGDLGKNNGNPGWQVMLNTSGQLYFHVYGNGNNFQGIGLNSEFSLTDGNWHQFAVTYTGGITKIFIDGIIKNSISVDHGNFDNSQAIFSVGFRPVTSSNLEFTGSLNLIRVGKTAPTAEQIAKIYRDEKQLFTDGAQSTLYGTSDAVTALAYDDSENLLHVGTASGRSVFNGLKRVDNTDVAVTTAISAKKGFVIAQ